MQETIEKTSKTGLSRQRSGDNYCLGEDITTRASCKSMKWKGVLLMTQLVHAMTYQSTLTIAVLRIRSAVRP